MKHIIALSFLFGAAVAAAGGIDPTEFDCPHDTARYQKLIQELRCLVCQIKRCQNQARRWQKTCVMSSTNGS